GPDHADTTFVSNHVPYIKNKKKRDSRRKEHHRKYEDFLHDVIKRCNNIGATPGASFQKGVECFLCCIDVCVCKKGSV
ncbi:MAG: hypothetical protein FWC67_01820, partial [Defluviitaleaceae bacterium]|nr:hypothetical protein [Defluviitaleaceae bacterium]